MIVVKLLGSLGALCLLALVFILLVVAVSGPWWLPLASLPWWGGGGFIGCFMLYELWHGY